MRVMALAVPPPPLPDPLPFRPQQSPSCSLPTYLPRRWGHPDSIADPAPCPPALLAPLPPPSARPPSERQQGARGVRVLLVQGAQSVDHAEHDDLSRRRADHQRRDVRLLPGSNSAAAFLRSVMDKREDIIHDRAGHQKHVRTSLFCCVAFSGVLWRSLRGSISPTLAAYGCHLMAVNGCSIPRICRIASTMSPTHTHTHTHTAPSTFRAAPVNA